MRTIYKNARVYREGRLSREDFISGSGDTREIDASDKIIAPGFIDLHAHLREPGFSYKETILRGTEKARAAGFQIVCAMPNLRPAPDCPENLKLETQIIERDAKVRVLPYATITLGREGRVVSDIEGLAGLVCGFSDDGCGVADARVMAEAMRRIARVGGRVAAHCEDMSLCPSGGCVRLGEVSRRFGVIGIPPESETRQLERDLRLAYETGVNYHVCHISAKASVDAVRRAKARGVRVTCEVTPHQLALSQRDIKFDSGRFKMNPPLGCERDREALIEAALDGTIDAIATDNAPHSDEEKSLGLARSAFGVEGFATAFGACAGVLPIERVLKLMIDGPARILGLNASAGPWQVIDTGCRICDMPYSPFYTRTINGGCECWIEG